MPAQRKVWWAQRGFGAFEADISGAGVTGERPISVFRPDRDGLAGSRLGVIPTDAELSQSERDLIAPLNAMAEVSAPWSIHAALLVARGQLDLTVQVRGQVWDYAATSLIVEEAGGPPAASMAPWPTPGPALFARSTALHTRALQILTATAPPRRSTEASHRR